MSDPVSSAVYSLANAWRKEAEARRRRTPGDAAATALETAASELEAVVQDAEAAAETLTVAQFAHAVHVNEATVRRWIARGELTAEKDGAGEWRIPRSARRHRPARAPRPQRPPLRRVG